LPRFCSVLRPRHCSFHLAVVFFFFSFAIRWDKSTFPHRKPQFCEPLFDGPFSCTFHRPPTYQPTLFHVKSPFRTVAVLGFFLFRRQFAFSLLAWCGLLRAVFWFFLKAAASCLPRSPQHVPGRTKALEIISLVLSSSPLVRRPHFPIYGIASPPFPTPLLAGHITSPVCHRVSPFFLLPNSRAFIIRTHVPQVKAPIRFSTLVTSPLCCPPRDPPLRGV